MGRYLRNAEDTVKLSANNKNDGFCILWNDLRPIDSEYYCETWELRRICPSIRSVRIDHDQVRVATPETALTNALTISDGRIF